MSELADRFSADLFEVELRNQADRDPNEAWELLWLLGLPLTIRRSYSRILEAQIDQDAYRCYLRRQSCYRLRDWRQPRSCSEVYCMAIQSVLPWTSLGRRQQRRKVPTVSRVPSRVVSGFATNPGRTQTRRPRSSQVLAQSPNHAPVPIRPPARVDTARPQPFIASKTTLVKAAHRPTANPNDIPKRPSTPVGLRDMLRADLPLSTQANGFDPVTLDSQSFSPRAPVTPPPQPHYGPSPLHPPGLSLLVDGKRIPDTIPFVVASGRHHVAPWQQYSIQEAAASICTLQAEEPGLLSGLVRLLFHSGLQDLGKSFSLNSDVICDFVRGWAVVSRGRLEGHMPEPQWQLCSCGGVNAC